MKIPSRIKEFSAQKIVNLMTIFLCSEMLHPHPKGCGFRICISDIRIVGDRGPKHTALPPIRDHVKRKMPRRSTFLYK